MCTTCRDIGREKLEDIRVSGLIGRRIFFVCLAKGLTGRQKKILATSAAKGRCVFSLKITLTRILQRRGYVLLLSTSDYDLGLGLEIARLRLPEPY